MHVTQRNQTRTRSTDVVPAHDDELSPLSPRAERVGVESEHVGFSSASIAAATSRYEKGSITYDADLDQKVSSLLKENASKLAEFVDMYLCVGHPDLKQKRTFSTAFLYLFLVPADERKAILIAVAEVTMVISGLMLALAPLSS